MDYADAPTRTVGLDEWFRVFDPAHLRQVWRGGVERPGFLPDIHCDVALSTDDRFPTLPIGIWAGWGQKRRNDTCTPFFPERGYVFDERDLDGEARKSKTEDASYRRFIDDTPYLFHAVFSYTSDRLTSDELSSLQGVGVIHLLLSFPNGVRLVSRVRRDIYIDEPIVLFRFDEFHPVDMPPVAEVPPFFGQGVQVGLPRDLKILATIEGRFLIPHQFDAASD